MSDLGENARLNVVTCPDCGWPCHPVSRDGVGSMCHCPECEASFFVPGTESKIGEEPDDASPLIRKRRDKKIVLPTEHTGNLRAHRPQKAKAGANAKVRQEAERKEEAEPVPEDDEANIRNPSEHRLNPEKRTKLIPLSDLVAESVDADEWRVEGLEKAGAEPDAAKEWSGKQFILLGFGLLLVVAIGIIAFGVQTDVETPVEPSAKSSDTEALAKITENLVAVTGQFLSSKSVDDRLRLVRNPELVQAKMEKYYSREGINNDLKIDGEPLATNLFSRNGAEFAGVVLDFSDLTRRGTIFQKQGDRWLLDWESFVGYSEMEWSDFLAEDVGKSVEFRLLASFDDYYNFSYSDDGKYICYKLVDVDSSATCWGYCERESATGKSLARSVRSANKKGIPAAEVVLRVSIGGVPVERKQARIDEFVQESHLSL